MPQRKHRTHFIHNWSRLQHEKNILQSNQINNAYPPLSLILSEDHIRSICLTNLPLHVDPAWRYVFDNQCLPGTAASTMDTKRNEIIKAGVQLKVSRM